MRSEVCFAIWQQNDDERALLPLIKHGTIDLHLTAAGNGVLHFQSARALNLNAVVKVGACGKAVGSKAGVRIIDLKKLNCGAGVILDGCF